MLEGFQNEKHARESTIGVASGIAAKVVNEHRKYTTDEHQRVEALLTTAELTLGLTTIPREPRALLTYSRRPLGSRMQPILSGPGEPERASTNGYGRIK